MYEVIELSWELNVIMHEKALALSAQLVLSIIIIISMTLDKSFEFSKSPFPHF